MVNIVVYNCPSRHKRTLAVHNLLYVTREDLGTTVGEIERVDETVERFKARLSYTALGAFVNQLVSSGGEIVISKAGSTIEIELK